MLHLSSIEELRAWRGDLEDSRRSLGFVPTMGFLHEGHLSLVRRSLEECDVTLVSIFVNPAQFGPEMDLDRYPRDHERDFALLEEMGVAAVFTPDEGMMYPEGYRTWVEVEEMTETLDGASRPGYFRGIATVVLKLFNLSRPRRAYFGLKDVQQAMMIRRMVRDLNLDMEVVPLPTVREADGLAMSSRNVFVEEEDRPAALALSRAIEAVRAAYAAGERKGGALVGVARALLEAEAKLEIDYVSLVDLEDFRPVDEVDAPVTLAMAVTLRGTRLIDNTILGEL